MTRNKRDRIRPTSFLSKTFDMVSHEDYRDIVSWTDDGNSFVIKDVNEFSSRILPLYFRHKNLASFIRQLNMYDFHKSKDSGEQQIFSHPNFVKGQKDLLDHIHRKTSELSQTMANTIKSANEAILNRCIQLQSQQEQMQNTINVLEKKYKDAMEINQKLMMDLINSREREQQIMQMFLNFSQSGYMNNNIN
mmetsp:Transcript_6847/g.6714  ORF Transcript_6847/g.6714 Transcript_6847/m.6714 type:complete len:192 (-) Transcript_6847:885-1460(-)